jgi:gas vesicle protein
MKSTLIAALVGFLFGSLFGAVLALVFAPMSGRELRDRVGREAETNYQKARAGYYKNVGKFQRKAGATQEKLSSVAS